MPDFESTVARRLAHIAHRLQGTMTPAPQFTASTRGPDLKLGKLGATPTKQQHFLTVGLVMLGAAALVGWSAPYFMQLEKAEQAYVAAASDLLFLISLFVLGGGFWANVRALFIPSASVVFPEFCVPKQSVQAAKPSELGAQVGKGDCVAAVWLRSSQPSPPGERQS